MIKLIILVPTHVHLLDPLSLIIVDYGPRSRFLLSLRRQQRLQVHRLELWLKLDLLHLRFTQRCGIGLWEDEGRGKWK